ncbi:MAG: hypothetical protein HPY74_05975 [Firmicutes bacterium]|nr:hypothetical protein [Bacillota bacterium]
MDIKRDVQDYIRRKKGELHMLLDHWAGELKGYAKLNAPWKDRTSQARQGLHSGVEDEGDRFILYLSHGKEYGTYLETGTGIYGPKKKPIKPVRNLEGLSHPIKQVKGMKPRAILQPTIERHIAEIEKDVREVWRD